MLLASGACQVLQAFSLTDKQFQQALQTAKLPDSLKDVGLKSFTVDAWRDLKGFFEAIDVWNMFCALYCANFRGILDNHESISIGASEMARVT